MSAGDLVEAQARELVASWPELSPEQRDRLAPLLTGGTSALQTAAS